MHIVQLYVCVYTVIVCETMFVHPDMTYAERRRSAPIMLMQSVPRTALIRRSASDPSLLPEYRKYQKDPTVSSLMPLKVCLLGNVILNGTLSCIFVLTKFLLT